MVLRRLPNTPPSAFKFAILQGLCNSLIMRYFLELRWPRLRSKNLGVAGAIWALSLSAREIDQHRPT